MVKTKKRYSKISTYGQAALGTFFMALAVRWIYEPQSMVTGGFSGIGIVLNRILPIPVSVTTLVLNIPLFLYSWKKKGFLFLGKSLWGMMCFSLFLAVLPLGTPGDDRLLAALLGGGISGVGLGLVIRVGGSTGGTDLLGSLFCDGKLGWSVSTVIGVLDGVIVLWGTVVYGLERGIYSVVAVFLSAKVLDWMLAGVDFAKTLYIITDNGDGVAGCLMEELLHGVTEINGVGKYSKERKKVLLCVVKKKELTKALGLIKECDERAFVIIGDAREVRGEGFTSL